MTAHDGESMASFSTSWTTDYSQTASLRLPSARCAPLVDSAAQPTGLASCASQQSTSSQIGAGLSTATPSLLEVWKEILDTGRLTGALDLIFSSAMLVFTLQYYGEFLRWHENRSDVETFATLSDPILPSLNAVDFSVPLFALAYGSLLLFLWYARATPNVLAEAMQTHALVMWVRMVALYLTPLEAPTGTIPLVDPIAHADGIVFVRDLFFSGHTATTSVSFLVCRRQHAQWKALFLAMALITACLVLWQKTHYTIDVFAAPFFVYTSHGCVREVRALLRAQG